MIQLHSVKCQMSSLHAQWLLRQFTCMFNINIFGPADLKYSTFRYTYPALKNLNKKIGVEKFKNWMVLDYYDKFSSLWFSVPVFVSLSEFLPPVPSLSLPTLFLAVSFCSIFPALSFSLALSSVLLSFSSHLKGCPQIVVHHSCDFHSCCSPLFLCYFHLLSYEDNSLYLDGCTQ